MGEMSVSTEVLVLGGGPGGYAAAFRAAQRGLDTTVVTDEADGLGGVCLLRGCIPSKALLEMTGRISLVRAASEAGIHFSEPEVDLGALQDWTDDVVDALVSGLDALAEGRGIRVLEGRGTFESPSRLRVEGAEVSVVDFEHAVIATGSRPVDLPDTPFGGPVWDSERALEMEEIPDTLLVVGAGYVGLEMGTVYARLGSAVTVVETMERILPMVDVELTAPLRSHLDELFDDIRLGSGVESLEGDEDGVEVVLDDGTRERFDAALVAVGRRPRTESLGLEPIGVELDGKGYIPVDETRRTGVDGVFAVGDVTGGKRLAHEAMREGKVAADVIAGEPAAFDARAVPAVVYTDPQIAWCGDLAEEDRSDGAEVDVARFPLRASGRARTMGAGAADGLVKLVTEVGSGRVLGAGFTGRHVESLVTEATLAMEMGATAEDLALTIHPHPTLSEGLGEAAEDILGLPTHFSSSDEAEEDR
ncbi:MAG: dihydrolipoyl dehydrogenase [Longimicrobiales bacterium]|nr:dihydrolipoyl dehydrogenase [Longimicrobiales bacterium]